MPKSLSEYLSWLDERRELRWPAPPDCRPVDATPYLKPIAGIRAVSWCVYGTLLRIHGRQLLHIHPQTVRMQIALQKTIDEFKMWNSMSRKPGQPWEYMLQQYSKVVEESAMAPTKRKGDFTEVDSGKVWYKLIDRLLRNEYEYDRSFYGPPEQLAVKVAYFFHAMLQGVGMSSNAVATMGRLAAAGLRQGLLDDGQAFTWNQLQRAIAQDAPGFSPESPISEDCTVLSSQFGIRKPSDTLFAIAAEQYGALGLSPGEVLYVSHRLRDDLSVARKHGFRTALYVGDDQNCDVEPADLRDPAVKPDRLTTHLMQVCDIVGA